MIMIKADKNKKKEKLIEIMIEKINPKNIIEKKGIESLRLIGLVYSSDKFMQIILRDK